MFGFSIQDQVGDSLNKWKLQNFEADLELFRNRSTAKYFEIY